MSDSNEHLVTRLDRQQSSIVRVCGRYRVGMLLGSGTSGDVYLGWDIKTGQDIALKLEPIQTQTPRLSHEHSVYKALSGVSGIPTMHWYGREVPYHVMVLDHLNLTVEEAISKCHDINSVFSYADQMLSCLKSLHEQSYIHQDVKPANFMTGIGELSQDIIKGYSIEKYGASILKMKIASSKTLCQGLPAPFVAFRQHIQSLGFDEKLQYDYLHSLLVQCLAHGSDCVVSNPITVLPSFGKLTPPANCPSPCSGQILHLSGHPTNVWVITRPLLMC
ncbi:kinase-like domain-containing protein [Lactarius indigo]|nr:kinase-like domain-containing protein [Lactarius indigo]